MGDIHPRVNDPRFANLDSVGFDFCHRNFVYYQRYPFTGLPPKYIFLDSHPCEIVFTVDLWIRKGIQIFATEQWYNYIKSRGFGEERVKHIVKISEGDMLKGVEEGIIPCHSEKENLWDSLQEKWVRMPIFVGGKAMNQ
jgi:hypothetical protein